MTDAPHVALKDVWNSCASREEALTTAFTRIIDGLTQAVAERGEATFAAAGGETPKPLFRSLAGATLPWEKISVLPTDDRWVSADHPYCNATMLRNYLAQHKAAQASIISLWCDKATPAEGMTEIAQRLKDVHFPIDVTLIGMGSDGHAASLFPGAPELAAALDPDNASLVAAITPNPMPAAAPVARMSLSLSTLAASRKMILYIFGQDKFETLQRAFDENDDFTPPVRKVIEAAGDRLEILWAA